MRPWGGGLKGEDKVVHRCKIPYPPQVKGSGPDFGLGLQVRVQ